jgi:hypothetical protein
MLVFGSLIPNASLACLEPQAVLDSIRVEIVFMVLFPFKLKTDRAINLALSALYNYLRLVLD